MALGCLLLIRYFAIFLLYSCAYKCVYIACMLHITSLLQVGSIFTGIPAESFTPDWKCHFVENRWNVWMYAGYNRKVTQLQHGVNLAGIEWKESVGRRSQHIITLRWGSYECHADGYGYSSESQQLRSTTNRRIAENYLQILNQPTSIAEDNRHTYTSRTQTYMYTYRMFTYQ